MSLTLHGDMTRPARVDTRSMEWQPSPSHTVWRKRLHLVGGAESGQVTSLVRYEPGSAFPVHDHPGGEEILVLEGTFSDEHGDWPAGTHLLNPEGFRHAPFSRDGCVLFVKLRQYAGPDRSYVKTDTRAMPWVKTRWPGVEAKTLHDDPRSPELTRLERWAPGASPGARTLAGGAEIFVVEGSLDDSEGQSGPGVWRRLPEGAVLDARSPTGAMLYVKIGALCTLRSVATPGRTPSGGGESVS